MNKYDKFKPENYATTKDNFICKKHILRVCMLDSFAYCPQCYDENKHLLELTEIDNAPKTKIWQLNNPHYYFTKTEVSNK